MMFQDDSDEASPADVGKFIPESELQAWFEGMKTKYPQVYQPDEKLYGCFDSMHPIDQKLMSYFDEDPNKKMTCQVKGLKWTKDTIMYQNKCPMYVISINGELSFIPFTSAHETSGWWKGWDVPPPAGWYD
eukprot:scaffold25739_cov113-Cylindrotheca_fusiformis.AAC.1